MTSKLNCPFCGEELDGDNMDVFGCKNKKCLQTVNMWGGVVIWQALIQSQQDLETARKAMNQVMFMGAKNNICYHLKAKTVKGILGKALKQIEHKDEQ